MSETTDMFQVLLSETLLDAVKKGLLNQDEVIEVDPRALIALPRLAIVKGILDMANLIDLSGRENKKMLFFKDKLTILDDVQEKLLALSRPELRAGLEKALCGFDEDALKDSLPCEIKPSQSETEDLAVLFRSISFLADDLLQSSPRSKEFHCIISRAMKMHST